ncbi:MAG: hypothetical protein LC099_09390 [Anaerolineales bacterium]|nr:hypothetical protein [Anaerolineales bacterium]
MAASALIIWQNHPEGLTVGAAHTTSWHMCGEDEYDKDRKNAFHGRASA